MKLFKAILPFMVLSGLFLLTGIILLIITDKQLLHLSINAMVGGVGDTFFKYYTYIGDGGVVAAIIVLTSLLKGKKFYIYLSLGISSFVVAGLLAQFFKRIVFYTYSRPFKVFGKTQINLVEGVDLHGSFSFPSGHSTVSFVLFIFLAYLLRKYRFLQLLCAILAILAAYSRVHLSQHFTEDIIAGSILGIITFYFMFWLHNRYFFKSQFL